MNATVPHGLFMLSIKSLAKTTPSANKHVRHYNFTAFLRLSAVFMVTLLLGLHGVAAGSCGEAQLCCNGRDSSCVVQKTPINAIIEDLNEKPCYCDHACLKLGDCCADFKDHCGVVDCEISDWGPWSSCDKSCGTGISTRTRKILQTALNGGKRCPSLIQKRSCRGFRCHREDPELQELALLLPAQMRPSEISKRTRWHKHPSKKFDKHEYCIEFEIIKVTKECRKVPHFNLLMEGDKAIVRCNIEAYQDKLENKTASTELAHKTYKLKKRELTDENERLFEQKDDFNNSVSEYKYTYTAGDEISTDGDIKKRYHDGNFAASYRKPQPQPQPKPKPTRSTTNEYRTKLLTQKMPTGSGQFHQHCHGDGAPGRITRWRSSHATACRGKWLRLTLEDHKKCKHAQFLFA